MTTNINPCTEYKKTSKRPPEGKCSICGTAIKSRVKYCGKECKRKGRKPCKKQSSSKYVISWRQRTKQKAVDYKGGCCQCCGYKECIKALTFHHIDPKKKTFSLGVDGKTRGWERIVQELDKCVLLCMNCHTETHAGLHPDYLIS